MLLSTKVCFFSMNEVKLSAKIPISFIILNLTTDAILEDSVKIYVLMHQ